MTPIQQMLLARNRPKLATIAARTIRAPERPLEPSVGAPSTVQRRSDITISTGPEIERLADDSSWPIQDFTGSIVTKGGGFFVLAARCQIMRNADLLVAWAEPFPRQRLVQCAPGDSLTVIVKGSGCIRSEFSLSSGLPGTATVVTVPPFMINGGVAVALFGAGSSNPAGTANGWIPTAQYVDRAAGGAITPAGFDPLSDGLVFTRAGGKHDLGYSSANGVLEATGPDQTVIVADPASIVGIPLADRRGLRLFQSGYLPPQMCVAWLVGGVFSAPGAGVQNPALSTLLRGVIVGPIYVNTAAQGFAPCFDFTFVSPELVTNVNCRVGIYRQGGDTASGSFTAGKINLFGLSAPMLSGPALARGVGFNYT